MSEPEFDVASVTILLQRVQSGDAGAWQPLLTEVHAVLRAMAHRRMEAEHAGHLLQTTALVNEAWVRLASADPRCFASRNEFLCAAGTAMRRVLVDEARRRKAVKRGAGAELLRISQISEVVPEREMGLRDPDVEALDVALRALESDPRHTKKCRVVEMRYFVGLTLEEVAEALGVSLATVKRDWEFARAWLMREMTRSAQA